MFQIILCCQVRILQTEKLKVLRAYSSISLKQDNKILFYKPYVYESTSEGHTINANYSDPLQLLTIQLDSLLSIKIMINKQRMRVNPQELTLNKLFTFTNCSAVKESQSFKVKYDSVLNIWVAVSLMISLINTYYLHNLIPMISKISFH